MRAKSLALLVLALGCGLVAAFGITQVMANKGAPEGPKANEVTIYVAKVKIETGTPITPDLLQAEHWPKDRVPQDALTKIKDIEGRYPRSPIYQDDPIVARKLFEKGQVGHKGIIKIPKGYRIVTIRSNAENTTHAGMVMPGTRVDVMVYFAANQGPGGGGSRIDTLLQNIKVYSVDAITDPSSEGAEGAASIRSQTISLLVTPVQYQQVALAQKLGEILLSPRAPDDDKKVVDTRLDMNDLFRDKLMGEASGEAIPIEGPMVRPEGIRSTGLVGNFIQRLTGGSDDADETDIEPPAQPLVEKLPVVETLPVVEMPAVKPVNSHIMELWAGGARSEVVLTEDAVTQRWRIANPGFAIPSAFEPAPDAATPDTEPETPDEELKDSMSSEQEELTQLEISVVR